MTRASPALSLLLLGGGVCRIPTFHQHQATFNCTLTAVLQPALMSSRASENEMPPADHSAGDDGEMGRVGAGTKGSLAS